MNGSFQWTSLLGISVILFLIIGGLWLLIGVLTPFLIKKANPEYLFVSQSTDTAYFGAPPSQLAPLGSPLVKLRTMLVIVISGFLIAGGMLVVCVAWFALRQGQPWALAALAVAIVPALVLWTLALSPYVRSGISLGLGDIPPLMSVPAILILPAAILGWLGLG
jgi:hypothetical protein